MNVNGVSFGLVTDGREDRMPVVEHLLDQIPSQGFPAWEVHIWGYLSRKYEHLASRTNVHMHFDLNTARMGYVTRAMNHACLAGQYDLRIMIHDDVLLATDFWEQLSGNDGEWDCLAPEFALVDYDPNVGYSKTGMLWFAKHGSRWTIGGPRGHRPLLRDEEWDAFSYMSGEIMIMKSHVLTDFVQWNPMNNINRTRGTPQAYDVEFGHACNKAKLVTGFDPAVRVFNMRHCMPDTRPLTYGKCT